MTIDHATLGKRLREARENSRISQKDAADGLSLPRTAIVHIEAGNRSVSTLELSEFATLYNRPIADFFADDLPENEDILVALFRVATGLEEDAEINEKVSQCVEICRQGVDLRSILGRKDQLGPPAYELSAPGNIEDAVKQGSQVAIEERRRLGLGMLPISDMSDHIANQGIWSSGAKLPDEMSGMFLRHASIGMAIIVNFDHGRARKRFSYAHEYAHALLDRHHQVAVTSRNNSSELIEKRANAFAAAFLMPSEGVQSMLHSLDKGAPSRQDHPVYDVALDARGDSHRRTIPGSQEITYQDIARLAHHFGVSCAAQTYRLRSLDIITKNECADLIKKEESGREYLKILGMSDDLEEQDKGKPDRELVSQVVHLALEAYRREVISRGKLIDLSKILGIMPSKVLVNLGEAARQA